VVMLDIDHFKAVNDRFGHAAGDRVLKSVADLCRAAKRDSDIIARLGGEEFAIMLPETTEAATVQFAERLRHLTSIVLSPPTVRRSRSRSASGSRAPAFGRRESKR